MNTTIFVLVMLWSSGSKMMSVQQEFHSLESCTQARLVLEKAHNGDTRKLVAQGCFKK